MTFNVITDLRPTTLRNISKTGVKIEGDSKTVPHKVD